MSRRAVLAVALAAASLAGSTGPAAAGTFTLTLTAPPGAQVGHPLLLQAAGTMPPEDVWFPYFLIAVVIPGSVTTTCPTGYWDGVQVANATGGGVLDLSAPISPDTAGAWSLPIGLNPWARGSFLLCAYVGDGADTTLARTQRTLTVGAGARPKNTLAPRVRVSAAALTCGKGRWANAPSRFAYAWLVDGVRRRGATRATLRRSRALAGHRVRCRVTAWNAAGSAAAVSRSVRVGR